MLYTNLVGGAGSLEVCGRGIPPPVAGAGRAIPLSFLTGSGLTSPAPSLAGAGREGGARAEPGRRELGPTNEQFMSEPDIMFS